MREREISFAEPTFFLRHSPNERSDTTSVMSQVSSYVMEFLMAKCGEEYAVNRLASMVNTQREDCFCEDPNGERQHFVLPSDAPAPSSVVNLISQTVQLEDVSGSRLRSHVAFK
jgi:GDP-D-mannose dehydratase